jgi:hypothetical protein
LRLNNFRARIQAPSLPRSLKNAAEFLAQIFSELRDWQIHKD